MTSFFNHFFGLILTRYRLINTFSVFLRQNWSRAKFFIYIYQFLIMRFSDGEKPLFLTWSGRGHSLDLEVHPMTWNLKMHTVRFLTWQATCWFLPRCSMMLGLEVNRESCQPPPVRRRWKTVRRGLILYEVALGPGITVKESLCHTLNSINFSIFLICVSNYETCVMPRSGAKFFQFCIVNSWILTASKLF